MFGKKKQEASNNIPTAQVEPIEIHKPEPQIAPLEPEELICQLLATINSNIGILAQNQGALHNDLIAMLEELKKLNAEVSKPN